MRFASPFVLIVILLMVLLMATRLLLSCLSCSSSEGLNIYVLQMCFPCSNLITVFTSHSHSTVAPIIVYQQAQSGTHADYRGEE